MYLDELTLSSFTTEEEPRQCYIRSFLKNMRYKLVRQGLVLESVCHTAAAFCLLTFHEGQRKKPLMSPALTWKLPFSSYVVVDWLTNSTKTDAAIREICPYL